MIDQIALGILSGTAILFSQSKSEHRQSSAPILGLLGQPFWFYAAYQSEQWAIFGLSFFYSYAWFVGLKQHWGNHIAKALGL